MRRRERLTVYARVQQEANEIVAALQLLLRYLRPKIIKHLIAFLRAVVIVVVVLGDALVENLVNPGAEHIAV